MTQERDPTWMLREELQGLLEEWTLTEVLEGLAAEAAYWKRHEKSESWDRARKMLLKTAVVTREIGL